MDLNLDVGRSGRIGRSGVQCCVGMERRREGFRMGYLHLENLLGD